MTKKCHVMTSCVYEINKELQRQSAGYVKVKLIACPLITRHKQLKKLVSLTVYREINVWVKLEEVHFFSTT